jgi:hypothetical protein
MPNGKVSSFDHPSPIMAVPGTPLPAVVASPAPTPPRGWESRPSLESRWRRRSQLARLGTRLRTRIEGIAQTAWGPRVLVRHDIDGNQVDEALDAAIHEVALRMSALTPQERTNPGNANYTHVSLTDDVTLVCAGKVLAVIVATPSGPRVFRFFSPVSQK